MKKLFLTRLITAGIFAFTLLSAADEATSETNDRLKKALENHPRADSNHDGILTRTELAAYLKRRKEYKNKAEERIAAFYKESPPTRENLKYGAHERNVLDLWQAKGETPRPLVIHIHGGGWIGGDKRRVSPSSVARFLQAGISVASINYRYSTISPYPTPLRDGALAVQYLRLHAGELNLDPQKVACYGGSAGAVTSLWIACSDDMADPDAEDPVLRQSTRLTCVGAINAPTMLDKQTVDEWFGMKVVTHPAYLPFFNIKDEAKVYSPKIRKLAIEASPITLLTKDDPPIYLDYQGRDTPLKAKHTPGQVVHHALLGRKLKEKADEIGVEAVFVSQRNTFPQGEDLVAFLTRKLGGKTTGKAKH